LSRPPAGQSFDTIQCILVHHAINADTSSPDLGPQLPKPATINSAPSSTARTPSPAALYARSSSLDDHQTAAGVRAYRRRRPGATSSTARSWTWRRAGCSADALLEREVKDVNERADRWVAPLRSVPVLARFQLDPDGQT
jgi:hypothetical protein